MFFFFKQKTAYEMRISDWSSDVCSSDLLGRRVHVITLQPREHRLCTHRRLAVSGFARWWRSEERRVGKSVSVRVDLGVRRIIKKKKIENTPLKYEYNSTNHYIKSMSNSRMR